MRHSAFLRNIIRVLDINNLNSACFQNDIIDLFIVREPLKDSTLTLYDTLNVPEVYRIPILTLCTQLYIYRKGNSTAERILNYKIAIITTQKLRDRVRDELWLNRWCTYSKIHATTLFGLNTTQGRAFIQKYVQRRPHFYTYLWTMRLVESNVI